MATFPSIAHSVVSDQSAVTSLSLATNWVQTAGNTLLACMQWDNSAVLNSGNGPTSAGLKFYKILASHVFGGAFLEIWYSPDMPPAASGAITVNMSMSVSCAPELYLADVSAPNTNGLVIDFALPLFATGSGTSSCTAGPMITSFPNELVIAYQADTTASATGPGTGWTGDGNSPTGFGAELQSQTQANAGASVTATTPMSGTTGGFTQAIFGIAPAPPPFDPGTQKRARKTYSFPSFPTPGVAQLGIGLLEGISSASTVGVLACTMAAVGGLTAYLQDNAAPGVSSLPTQQRVATWKPGLPITGVPTLGVGLLEPNPVVPGPMQATMAGVGALTATLTGAGALSDTMNAVGTLTAFVQDNAAPGPFLPTQQRGPNAPPPLPVPGVPQLGSGLLQAGPPASTTGQLVDTMNGVGALVATLSGTGAVSDTMNAVGGLTAFLMDAAAPGFQSVGTQQPVAGWVPPFPITGVPVLGSGVLNPFSQEGPIIDIMNGVGGLSATLAGTGALSDTMAGVGALSANLLGAGALSDTMNAAGGLSAFIQDNAAPGTFRPTRQLLPGYPKAVGLTGVVQLGYSLWNPFTLPGNALVDIMNGVGGLSATLTGAGALAATMAATGGLTANLLGAGALGSTMAGTGALTGTLTGTGTLALTSSGVGALVAPLLGSGFLSVAMAGAGALLATGWAILPPPAGYLALGTQQRGPRSQPPLPVPGVPLLGSGILAVSSLPPAVLPTLPTFSVHLTAFQLLQAKAEPQDFYVTQGSQAMVVCRLAIPLTFTPVDPDGQMLSAFAHGPDGSTTPLAVTRISKGLYSTSASIPLQGAWPIRFTGTYGGWPLVVETQVYGIAPNF